MTQRFRGKPRDVTGCGQRQRAVQRQLCGRDGIARDLDAVKSLGTNLIRVMVSPPGSPSYNNGYASYYGSEAVFLEELDQVVKLGLERGMVVLILPSGRDDPQYFRDFQAYLAQTYKEEPYVWLGAQNEPSTCYSGDSCWSKWQATHDSYVATLRSNGYQGPIMINSRFSPAIR